MNCSDRIYHQNGYGLSVRCTCQDAVHLYFGNISLLLSKPQLNDFAKYVSETVVSERYLPDPDERCIFIPTRDYYMMFAMTYNELKGLSDILDQTMIVIQIDEALGAQG